MNNTNKSHPIHIVLEDIRSAFNVGAFFRTADAAGIEKLYLNGITPYPPHNRIPKTALGATNTVHWEYEKNITLTIDKLQTQNIPVVGVELTKTAIEYTKYKFSKPVALVFGNEVNGVTPETLEKCTDVVQIPMFGQKKSLNVEVSFGILVYEIIRQYNEN